MELEKQKLLLSYLISDQELFIKVSPILNTKYFDTSLKPAVTFVKDYFEQYKAPPTVDQLKAETGSTVSLRPTMTRQELKYAEDQLEAFCKEKAIEHAILASPALLAEGKHGDIEKLIRDALTVGLQRNIGLDYFHDPEQRLKLLSLNNKPTPTGFVKLDEYLGGGINRKEMIIFAAPPGVGKSLTMANLARNLMKRSLNVVYITLELSEEVVAKRFDSMFTGIAQVDILKNITKTTIEITKQASEFGGLTIKRMPESSTNANHIRAYLKEYEIMKGHVPDAMVVDYMDLMASNQSISAENQFIRDKYISEELRSIANEFNLMMITASQLNRGSQMLETMEDLSQAHIAGGISKVNTTDNLVAIMQTSAMKARSEMVFKLLKTRSSNGVGNQFMMTFNPSTLILECFAEEDGATDRSKTLANYMRGKVAKKADDGDTGGQAQVSRPQTPSGPTPKMDINKLPFQI
jgi:KaiC/GvpD/RAD55 family RecA-like ATPase